MKFSSVFFAVVSVGVVGAAAQSVSLSYSDIVRESRRLEKLEGSEYVISPKILGHRVRLNLQAFGRGSDSYYVNKNDEIAFTCRRTAKGFNGGLVEAVITKHEPGAEGSNFFELDNCTNMK